MFKEVLGEVKVFLKSSDNTVGFELGKIRNNKVISILDSDGDPVFNIVYQIKQGITIDAKGELFDETCANQLSRYIISGKRNIFDILAKAVVIYQNLMDEEESQEQDALKKNSDSMENIESKYKKPIDASEATVNVIAKEYISMCEEATSKFGFSCHLINDDLFHWEVHLFGFDNSHGGIATDLKEYSRKFGQDYIKLEVSFPNNYPSMPPFIRVINPIFIYRTGHVTIGGSLCMEVLTTSGWKEGISIENIIIQIRTEMVAGKARLNLDSKGYYTEYEAKQAFFRVARRYGWEK